jgi:hypothetical protein
MPVSGRADTLRRPGERPAAQRRERLRGRPDRVRAAREVVRDRAVRPLQPQQVATRAGRGAADRGERLDRPRGRLRVGRVAAIQAVARTRIARSAWIAAAVMFESLGTPPIQP